MPNFTAPLMDKLRLSTTKPLLIFLAEDDLDDILLFKEGIESLKFQTSVVVFNHGGEVCKHVQDTLLSPDLIFLDLNMPLVNGIACATILRKGPLYNHIPIIIYTTSSFEKDVDKAFEAGANLFITKGFSFEEQVAVLDAVLTLHSNEKLLNRSRDNFVFKLDN